MSCNKYLLFFAIIFIISTVEIYAAAVPSPNSIETINELFRNISLHIQKPVFNSSRIFNNFEDIDFDPDFDDPDEDYGGYPTIIYIPGYGYTYYYGGASSVQNTKLLTTIGVLVTLWGMVKTLN